MTPKKITKYALGVIPVSMLIYFVSIASVGTSVLTCTSCNGPIKDTTAVQMTTQPAVQTPTQPTVGTTVNSGPIKDTTQAARQTDAKSMKADSNLKLKK